MTLNKPTRIVLVIYYILVFTGLVFAHLNLSEYATDDAYIHLRIVENFINNGHPYYNSSEAVMTSSSSLWTLLLSFIFLFFPISTNAVAIANALFCTLLGLVLSCLTKEILNTKKICFDFILSIFAIATVFVASVQLMETPLALLVFSLGLLLYLKERNLAFTCLALSIFLRLELIIFLVLIIFYNLWQKKVKVLPMLFATAVPIALVCFYNLYFFNTNLPQTVTAKQIIYTLSSFNVLALATLNYLGEEFVASYVLIVPIFLACLTFLFYILLIRIQRNSISSKEPIILLFGAILIFAAYIYQKVFIFPWYTPLYILPFGLALILYAHLYRELILKIVSYIILAPLLCNFALNLYAAFFDATQFSEFKGGAKAAKYLEIAEQLNSKYPKHSLLTSEIGALGWGFKGHIYDSAGLASPAALKHYKNKENKGMVGAISLEYALEVNPAIIVGIDLHIKEILNSDFANKYTLYKERIFRTKDMTEDTNYLHSKQINILVQNDTTE